MRRPAVKVRPPASLRAVAATDEQRTCTVCHRAAVILPPLPTSPGQGRRFLAEHLAHWEVTGETVDTALLLLTEAVTNASVHAGTSSTVTVALTADRLQVSVADGAPAPAGGSGERWSGSRSGPRSSSQGRLPEQPSAPDARTKDPLAESGRGLLLINALADRWDVADLPNGKLLRFQLTVARSCRQRAACACP